MRKVAVLAAAALLLILIGVLVVDSALFGGPRQQTTESGASETTSYSLVGTNETASVSSIEGLRLSLSVNTTEVVPGRPILISVEEHNTSPQAVNVTAADDWATESYGSNGGCSGPDVAGYAIFAGNLTTRELSHETRLQLFGIGGCLPADNAYSYLFQPESSNATEAHGCIPNDNGNGEANSCYGCGSPTPGPCNYLKLEPIQARVSNSVESYYLSDSGPSQFALGAYTAVGVDEWGAIVIIHFSVMS